MPFLGGGGGGGMCVGGVVCVCVCVWGGGGGGGQNGQSFLVANKIQITMRWAIMLYKLFYLKHLSIVVSLYCQWPIIVNFTHAQYKISIIR